MPEPLSLISSNSSPNSFKRILIEVAPFKKPYFNQKKKRKKKRLIPESNEFSTSSLTALAVQHNKNKKNNNNNKLYYKQQQDERDKREREVNQDLQLLVHCKCDKQNPII